MSEQDEAPKRRIVSLIVPFLNEQENLPLLYDRCNKVSQGLKEELEFVFIDDGSTDGSLPWVMQTAEKNPAVKYIQLSRNFGHQRAITAGMNLCNGDAAIIIDADLQDPPEVIADMIMKWKEGFEVVHAVRSSRKGESGLKKLLAHLFYRILSKMTEVQMTVDAGDFRLLDRKALNALNSMPEQHRYMRGLASWIGFNQTTVEYVRDARHAGVTKYPLIKSIGLALNAITSFSGTPLRLLFYLGTLLCLLSIGIGVYLFVAWNFVQRMSPSHAGTTYLTLAIFFVSGLQLFGMGILGQYLRRVFDEIKDRPLYLVSDSNL
ncbi:glycosyltransferase family 2 protein [Pontiella sulfatireligans]|uniref:Putative glycosyltransferase n=1 Tax=Pontiella sulfatireligans TaxID=2750658 RepID=A0A6C2UM80_9BACT|nr:glycosyltransferase family 2 protein [Pontiella sulfatireligans]VGO21023.1 putative glycosyltransferase [Pontiella sulfatireligans]